MPIFRPVPSQRLLILLFILPELNCPILELNINAIIQHICIYA